MGFRVLHFINKHCTAEAPETLTVIKEFPDAAGFVGVMQTHTGHRVAVLGVNMRDNVAGNFKPYLKSAQGILRQYDKHHNGGLV